MAYDLKDDTEWLSVHTLAKGAVASLLLSQGTPSTNGFNKIRINLEQ